MTTTRKKATCITCSGSRVVPGPCVDAAGRPVSCARPGACPHDQDGDVPCPDCQMVRECAVCGHDCNTDTHYLYDRGDGVSEAVHRVCFEGEREGDSTDVFPGEPPR